MPRHPSIYGSLLRQLIAEHNVDCWLVNTGWTGGKYGEGRRMPIDATRTLLTAALNGNLNSVEMRTDPIFGLNVPVAVDGIEPSILNPRETWADGDAFDSQAQLLVDMFIENFQKFAAEVEPDVLEAGPQRVAASE
ncbi:phosphoenolpyruvate carboxykinase [bacterium MnTg02]|nr:phosphoenolpyruvate carboxykinase [bacterium MnTg02]